MTSRPRLTDGTDCSAVLVFVFFAVAVAALLAGAWCDHHYNLGAYGEAEHLERER